MFKLIFTSLIEPFVFHTRTVWWSIVGNYDMLTGTNKGWGEMNRRGFGDTTTKKMK